VEIENINEVYIRINCSQSVAYELRDHFTFLVPGAQFTPAFKSKKWDGRIRLFNIVNNSLYRGLTEEVRKYCEDSGYECSGGDLATEFSLIEAQKYIKDLNPKFEPRDYQVAAFIRAIRHKRMLLLSPTASGKSLILYLIMRKLVEDGKRGLIIVPNVSLVEQLHGDFEEYSEKNGWNVEDHVHKIYQGKDKVTKKAVTISTWQSIYQLNTPYFKQFDFVLGDECHLFKAKSLIEIMNKTVNAAYRIGTTGTLDGTKTHKLVLEGVFGPVSKSVTTKELIDRKQLADFSIKALLLKHSEETCKRMKEATYKEEIEYLVLNDARNTFIKNLALSLEGNTLILYQYVDKHGQILYDKIRNENPDRNVYFIHGGVDVEDRENVRKQVEEDTSAIIVASYGTFSTGINLRNLHNIIFASPSKSRIRNLQSIGRGLRISDTKTSAVLFDIADDLKHKKHENFTLKHLFERIRVYMEEKFQFKLYKIDLKDKPK